MAHRRKLMWMPIAELIIVNCLYKTDVFMKKFQAVKSPSSHRGVYWRCLVSICYSNCLQSHSTEVSQMQVLPLQTFKVKWFDSYPWCIMVGAATGKFEKFRGHQNQKKNFQRVSTLGCNRALWILTQFLLSWKWAPRSAQLGKLGWSKGLWGPTGRSCFPLQHPDTSVVYCISVLCLAAEVLMCSWTEEQLEKEL